MTIPRVSPSLVGAALAALSRCACARVRALATAGVGVTVGSERGRRAGPGRRVIATPRPLDGAALQAGVLARSSPPADRGREESRAGVVLAGSPLPAPALPPVAWPDPTAPLDGVVCGPPMRPTRPTTCIRELCARAGQG